MAAGVGSRVGDVNRNADRGYARLVRDRRCLGDGLAAVEVPHGHRSPGLGQEAGAGPADARGAAGDDDPGRRGVGNLTHGERVTHRSRLGEAETDPATLQHVTPNPFDEARGAVARGPRQHRPRRVLLRDPGPNGLRRRRTLLRRGRRLRRRPASEHGRRRSGRRHREVDPRDRRRRALCDGRGHGGRQHSLRDDAADAKSGISRPARSATIPVLGVHEIAKSKIIRWQEFWDQRSLTKQLPPIWHETRQQGAR